MGYEITKIEMPKNGELGILQINTLYNTYFRFEIMNGKAVLDTCLFVENLEDPNERHQDLSSESELYQGVQNALNQYMDKNIYITEDLFVSSEEQPKLHELIQCIEDRAHKKTLKAIIGYFNMRLPSIRKDIDDFKCDITLSERKILHTDILAKDCIGRIYVFKISFCPDTDWYTLERMVFWEHRITEIYDFVAAGGQK